MKVSFRVRVNGKWFDIRCHSPHLAAHQAIAAYRVSVGEHDWKDKEPRTYRVLVEVKE